MPARIRRPTLPPFGPAHAIANTSVAASRPKTSAPTGSSAIEPGKTRMMSSAPKPAPPVTPITSGDASGLASAPCSSAPATPSAAPTVAASTVRGNRSCMTIRSCGVSPVPPASSASTTVRNGTSTAPSASDAPIPATSAAAATRTTAVFRTIRTTSS